MKKGKLKGCENGRVLGKLKDGKLKGCGNGKKDVKLTVIDMLIILANTSRK